MGIAAIMGIVMDEGFLHLVGIFLISGVKFLVGLGWAIAFVENDWIGFFVASMGGIFGSFIWIFMGHWIQSKWIQFQRDRFEKKTIASGLERGEFVVKKFSKKNRKLVKLKRWGGVYLLVFLAPLIISIPVGCLILSTMESNRFRILGLMSISVLMWGVFVYTIVPLFS
jgi:membrane protein YqaA with SNARE-associated domain